MLKTFRPSVLNEDFLLVCAKAVIDSIPDEQFSMMTAHQVRALAVKEYHVRCRAAAANEQKVSAANPYRQAARKLARAAS